MLNEIQPEWKQYKAQIICTFLIFVLGMILGFAEEWGLGYVLQLGILIYDFILIYGKQDTITKWSRRQFPGWMDKILMIVLWVLIVKYGSYGNGWGTSYWFTMGTINGHINWEK